MKNDHRYHVATLAAVGVAVSLTASCEGGRNYQRFTDCANPPCDDSGLRPLCVGDAECPGDQTCVGGTCQARPDEGGSPICDSTQDCDVGLLCNLATRRCVECLNDDQCDIGQECRRDNTCGPAESGPCSSDTDCSALHCNPSDGLCVQCVTDLQCPTGQVCRNNTCNVDTTGGGTSGQCATQADCTPYGKICDTTAHACRSCQTDGECGTGRMCSGGICTADPGTGGGGGGGGGTNGTCVVHSDCPGSACYLGMCMDCFSDFMCIDMDSLFSGTVTVCDIATGECVLPECETATDCAQGEGCLNGHCGQCLDDSDCRSGQECNSSGACVQESTQPQCTSNAQCSGGRVCLGGQCASCTSSTQCGQGRLCQAGTCVTDGTVGGGEGAAFGESCSGTTACAQGLVCLTSGESTFCTRTCIGSGKGGDADCPIGNTCENFETGTLDGLQLCNSASALPSDYPGQPFTQAPGSSCASGNSCQSGICLSDTQECARACMANRDCDSGEECWAAWNQTNDAMLGLHLCFASDTTTFRAVGAACNSGAQCDTGLCAGTCTNGDVCNQDSDCTSGTCSGSCVEHCRSNADCGSTQSCNPWPAQATDYTGWLQVCLPKFYSGTRGDGASCTAHSDCNSDWCIDSVCTTPCGITADCTGSLGTKHCSPVTFQDDAGNPVYSMAFCL